MPKIKRVREKEYFSFEEVRKTYLPKDVSPIRDNKQGEYDPERAGVTIAESLLQTIRESLSV